MDSYSTMWAYLWDLVDDGVEASVRRLREEVGLNAVSVATAYHTYQQLRPRSPGRKIVVADRAAVYFQPDANLFRDTCLEPFVAPVAQAGNPMARLAEACRTTGLDLISWTVCLHNTYLATRYPQCAVQTAYGDPLPHALCPGVDDVRAYLVAVCRDLASNYGVKRLELESCDVGGYGHAHYHAKEGVDLGEVGRYLFDLSFSSGCEAKARARGIDVDGLRRWVRQQLDPAFATGKPVAGSRSELLEQRPDVAAFQQLREDLVVSLVREIREATGLEVAYMGGGRRFAEVADLLEILAYTDSPDRVEAQTREAFADLDRPTRLVVGLQAYHPCAHSAEDLQANVERAESLGVRQFSFYNYGIMPPVCLEWVRQALRH